MPMVPSWYPPPREEFHFSDCGAASRFVRYVSPNITVEKASNQSAAAVLPFLRSLVPSNWTPVDAYYQPKRWELLRWWEESRGNKTDVYIHKKAFEMVEGKCNRDFCDFLALEGDPDLVGVGVSF